MDTTVTALHELGAQIGSASAEDDALFCTLIARGLELTQTRDAEFAEEVNVSRPTVTRWRNQHGLPHPHPALRPTIYAALRTRVDRAVRGVSG
jgi:hypothetical protein